MSKLVQLFEEFMIKAIDQTEKALQIDLEKDDREMAYFTANRERLLAVIDQIAAQVDWEAVAEDRRAEISKQVEYIKKLDEQLIIKLQAYKETVRAEIETTHRSKENIKGYNLTDVK